ncbi:hypothetical protein HDV06_005023 [Boothiomyces sp. JEL0866]|nr:hypothetical protein HDV06_005023 [Boothiomyces sp. JEL0866]
MTPKAPGGEKVEFDQETQSFKYTDSTNVTFDFDMQKKAWFPRIDERIMEAQQSVYKVEGVDETAPVINPSLKRKLDKQKGVIHKKPKPEPVKRQTAVYVTGLPSNVTMEEMIDTFKKGGVFLLDVLTGEPKIKLYRNDKNELKGDALVIYLREESVKLACELLDESYIHSSKIRVQPAVFQDKEKPKEHPILDKKSLKQNVMKMKRQLEWFDEAESTKPLKAVVLKHMFTLDEINEQPELIIDLKQDVRDECENFGQVTNVILFDLEPDGVMLVRYKSDASALACVERMNGRFFAGRKIEAYLSKGNDNFKKSKKNMEDDEKRQEEYGKWLEEQDD